MADGTITINVLDLPAVMAMQAELRRIRKALYCDDKDSITDPLAVIAMIQQWEVDAQRRAELLEEHLRAVLEVAETWQPDYATAMDIATIKHARALVDRKMPSKQSVGPA